MTARIYRPAKSAMQSGRAKTEEWVLEFEPASPLKIEPLMGYTASADTQVQVRLKFPTAEAAIAYCDRHGISYFVQNPTEPRRRRTSYFENFAFGRKTPWTH
mgnify:CR=1 FL=1